MVDHNQYAERIKANFRLLVRSMDPSEQFLTELSFIDCLKDDIIGVESLDTDDDKNSRLLRILLSKSTNTVHEFIKLLRENEQNHVANVFQANRHDNCWPMSQEHLELLRKKKDEICDYLDPGVDLLTALQSSEVLTSRDVSRIQSKQDDRKMSDKLLQILERKPDRAFARFIASLKKTQQCHIPYILTGEGEAPIGKYLIRMLDRNRCRVFEKLEPLKSNLVDELLAQGAITATEYQRIRGEKTRYEQSVYLVDIFKRKTNKAFQCFIKTLRQTRQGHIAKLILDGVDVNGTVRLIFDQSFDQIEPTEVEEALLAELTRDELFPQLRQEGILTTVSRGSIHITFHCTPGESATRLRQLYETGAIDSMLYEDHGRQLTPCGLRGLTVDIEASEFENVESCEIMTPEHSNRLQEASDTFAPNELIVTEALLSRLSLFSRTRESILTQPTQEQRSRRLFDAISRRPDSEFQRLVDALRYTNNGRVADFLANVTANAGPKFSSPKKQGSWGQCSNIMNRSPERKKNPYQISTGNLALLVTKSNQNIFDDDKRNNIRNTLRDLLNGVHDNTSKLDGFDKLSKFLLGGNLDKLDAKSQVIEALLFDQENGYGTKHQTLFTPVQIRLDQTNMSTVSKAPQLYMSPISLTRRELTPQVSDPTLQRQINRNTLYEFCINMRQQ